MIKPFTAKNSSVLAVSDKDDYFAIMLTVMERNVELVKSNHERLMSANEFVGANESTVIEIVHIESGLPYSQYDNSIGWMIE